MNLTLNAQR